MMKFVHKFAALSPLLLSFMSLVGCNHHHHQHHRQSVEIVETSIELNKKFHKNICCKGNDKKNNQLPAVIIISNIFNQMRCVIRRYFIISICIYSILIFKHSIGTVQCFSDSMAHSLNSPSNIKIVSIFQ